MRLAKLNLRLLPVLFLLLAIVSPRADDSNAVQEVWHLMISKNFATRSSCAVASDGTIYQGNFEGELLSIAPDGVVNWKFKAGLEIWSSPAVAADGTIYFGSRDRNLYALTPDGKLIWKFATGGWVDSSPAIATDGTIYFGSWDGNFYAVSPDGNLKWQFATSSLVNSSPAIATNGTIYFGSHDKKLYALTPDGKLKWSFATGAEMDGSPAIAADGTVYVPSTDGNLYAIRPDGTKLWQYHSGGFTASSPVVDSQGNLFLAANSYQIAVSSDGKLIWQHPTDVPMDMAWALTTNGMVYVSMPWLQLSAMDRMRCWPPPWNFHTHFNLSSSPNMNPEGIIYACDGPYLYAVKPPNAAPLENTSWPMWRSDPQHTGRAHPVKGGK